MPALGEAKVDQLLGGVPTVEEDIDAAVWGKEGFDLGKHLLCQGELAVEVQPGMRGAIAVQPADGALSQVGAPFDRVGLAGDVHTAGDHRQPIGVALPTPAVCSV